MALIKCRECGKKISDKAEKCVNCGAPIVLNDKSQVKKIEEDEELRYLKSYINKDKKIIIGVAVVLVLIFMAIGISGLIGKQKEKAEYLETEKRWMKNFDGFYRSAGISPVHLTLNEDGSSSLCYGSSCTYPRFKYAYPNKLEFSDDNNYYTSCERVCGYPDLTGRLVSGLDCYRPNGDIEFVTKMSGLGYDDYIMCGEE